MKTFIPLTIAAALIAASSSMAETVAYSKPSGYVDLGSVAARSEMAFSVPLLQAAEASAVVDSASGDTITLSSASLDAGAYDAPADGAPYLVEVTSGVDAGLFLVVQSNTDSTITVVLGNGEGLDELASGDTLALRKAWTLESLFPSSSLPDGVRVAAFDDQAGIENSASPLYLNNSSFGGWIDGSSFEPASNAVLYPGESFTLINNSDEEISSLVIAGQVPLSPSRLRIGKDAADVAQDTRIGYVGPVEEVLDDAGFDPSTNDRILVYDPTTVGMDKSASKIIIYNEAFGGWVDGSSFEPVGSTFKLQGGHGYVYRRSAEAPVGDQIITDEQSYIPHINQ